MIAICGIERAMLCFWDGRLAKVETPAWANDM